MGSAAPPAAIDLSRIVGTSFRIYLQRWRPHLAAAMVSQLPALIPTLVLMSLLLEATVGVLVTRSPEALVPAAILSFLVLAVSFFSAFLFVLMSAVACQLVAYWLERRDVRLVAAYATALRRFWRLAGAMLAAFAIICGGFVALGAFFALFYIGFVMVLNIDIASNPYVFWAMLIPSCFAALAACLILLDALVRWSVFVQAVMIEGRGPIESLARSAELVRGNWWRTAGAMALLLVVPLLLTIIVASILNIVFLPLSGLGFLSMHATNGAAIAVAQVLLSPVPAIGVTILFFRLRDGRSIWDQVDARARSERG